ncbi:recombinase family protein [Novosphingobium sp.]|uniref:recombinase family protein n=1 Tax=Novosphingobium sp. TaxID=1874826 RepID=UPI001ECA330C|nr:recombinase family protein [Novosphingobium sp.]MBK9011256.1 recombinase family protein [Novosphingobium sp.]
MTQTHEEASSELYDDGGYLAVRWTGWDCSNPLADVEAGKVDVIVVYKVDRLTRN